MKACAVLALASALVCVGCDPFGPEATVNVVVPPPPLVWLQAFPELRCRVVYPDAHGVNQSVEAADWSQSIPISCSKAGNTPVLAFPVTVRDEVEGVTGGGYLRPAGGLYPSSLESRPGGDALLLSWQDGALASVVARVRNAGRDVSSFNAARLAAYLGRTSDPWTLDLDGIAELIAGGELQADDIRALPHYRVRLAARPGTWFLESALSPPEQSAGDMIEFPTVAEGTHALFSLDGEAMFFQVNREGVALMP